MNQKPISDTYELTKRLDWLATFAGPSKLCELSGPVTLIRAVQFEKNTYDGLQLGNSRRDGEPLVFRGIIGAGAGAQGSGGIE